MVKGVIDLVTDETDYHEDFEKSGREIETYESTNELKYPQGYEDGDMTILDDSNKKKMIDPRTQAMFKRSRHNNLSIFIISQDYYELPKKLLELWEVFKPNNFRDVQNLYQAKSSMDMTVKEFKLLSSTCWNEKYQPLTIDMAEDKYTGRYRLGLSSLFVPQRHHFLKFNK